MSIISRLFTRKDDLTRYSVQLSKLTEKIEQTNKKLDKNNKQNHYYKLFVLSIISILISSAIQWAVPHFLTSKIKIVLNLVTLVWPFVYYKFLQVRHNVLLKRLTVLRERHNATLEELKNKTSFYNTAAIINRYSAGQYGDQDEAKILDQEVLQKQEQLNEIRKELQENSKQSKEETDKWFDKCLNALAGGDTLGGPLPHTSTGNLDPINSQTMVRIICPQCQYDSGMYKLKDDNSCVFSCPHCSFKGALDGSKKTNSMLNAIEPPENADKN
ncbi:hypothetical protein ACO0QE_001795 [Hanseniaspora vineae]